MYNIVFFATEYDWYTFMYKEILDKENVLFYKSIEELFDSSELLKYKTGNKEGYDLLFEKAIERIVFNNANPLCFIRFSRFLPHMKNGLLIAERRVFPFCKRVHYFTDYRHITEQNVSFLKRSVNAIGVYDPNIAKIFNFKFWANSFPWIELPQKTIEFELCFVGYGMG